MYIINRMPSGRWFGECFEDNYYYEGDTYFDVSEQLEKHEAKISKGKD